MNSSFFMLMMALMLVNGFGSGYFMGWTRAAHAFSVGYQAAHDKLAPPCGSPAEIVLESGE